MKNIILIFLTIILGVQSKSQNCTNCPGTKSLNLTTGLNTSGTLITANGSVDPYWQLVNIAPPSINGSGGILIPKAYTIQSGTSVGFPNWCDIPGAKSLSVIPNYTFPTNNQIASQPWRFVRKFNLCQNASVHFVVDHIGDDVDTLKIFNSNGTQLYANTGIGWGAIKHFDVTLPMNAGCCYLTLELANIGAALMGFSVKANLSTTINALSNPNQVCCGTSIISGQKIIDANCDGRVSTGELPGVGWTFNLMNGASIVQTATTDGNGEFTFYNISNGTYSIQEVVQSGFTPSNPTSGQIVVVVSAVNSVQTFQFLNCPAPPCSCGKWLTTPTLDNIPIPGVPVSLHPDLSQERVNTTAADNGGSGQAQIIKNYPVQFVQGNVSGNITAAYQCNGECPATYTWQITNGTGSIANGNTNSINLAAYNGQLKCGSYNLILKAKCGNSDCGSYAIPITIICEPPSCCKASPDIDLNNSFVNTVTNISNPNAYSVGNFNYNINHSLPMSEVRVSVEEFRLVANSPNCLNCNNRPVTWGNILSASLNGTPMTLSGLVGPATGSLPADYREAVYNTGTLLLPYSAGLNIQLSLPAVTELSCCEVSAYVCLKFTFKDAQCRECVQMVCSNIKLVPNTKPHVPPINSKEALKSMDTKSFKVGH